MHTVRRLLTVALALTAAADARAGMTTWVTPGGFSPRGVALSQSGDVLIADDISQRIVAYSQAGELKRTFAVFSGANNFPTAITAAPDGGAWVVVFQTVTQVHADGSIGLTKEMPPFPTGLALGPNGHLYVANASTCTITELTTTDPITEVRHWGTCGTGPGQFSDRLVNRHLGVALAPDGDVYVADSGNYRVQRFSADGTWLATIGGPGSGAGQFGGDFPVELGLTVDAHGDLYVGAGCRIEKLTASGEFISSVTAPYGCGHDPGLVALAPNDVIATQFLGYGRVSRVTSTPTVDSISVARGALPFIPVGDSRQLLASVTAPFSPIVSYKWDTDGDGTFETDTGSDPSPTVRFDHPGHVRVSVRATNALGETATGTTDLTVYPPPPSGPPGVSIENGAQFTNQPEVRVRVVWPPLALSGLLANDGGFAGAKRFALAETVPWTLDSSGPERLPKTIYVRFDSNSTTYQDDIILDETVPRLANGTVSGRHRFVVRTKASDRTSGLATLQTAVKTSHPFKAVTYRSRVELVLAGRPKFARVRDRAGNWSRWHALARR